MNREDCWKKKIVIICPIGRNENTINDCFDTCEFSDYHYVNGVGIVYCAIKDRELHSGNYIRNN